MHTNLKRKVYLATSLNLVSFKDSVQFDCTILECHQHWAVLFPSLRGRILPILLQGYEATR